MSISVKTTGQIFETYLEYVRSFYWQDKAKAFKAYVTLKGVCQLCRKKKKRIDVYHRSYKNLGNEPFEDLILVCTACYAEIKPGYERAALF